jgi:hypothetical protein
LNRQIFLASRSTPVSLLNVTFVLCLVLWLSSCVVSPAPNYRIDKTAVRIEFTAGQSPELHLSASYNLENYGTSVLAFIDVMLPNETRYRIRNLLVKVDGQTVNSAQGLEGSSEARTSNIRVPFDPGWHPRERRDLVIEYNFNAQDGAEKSGVLAAASFYLISPGWLPALQPPNHVLSSTPAIPEGTTCSVEVPADFLVLASGKPRGRKKNRGTVKYQFELRKEDLAPYVIAGRYVETPPSRQKNSVSFWTFGPLKGDPTGVEKEIASVSDVLHKNFGPLDKNSPGVRIVESAGASSDVTSEPQAIPFPAGVLVSSQAMAAGIESPGFSKFISSALARSWFANISGPDSPIGISEGLPEYAEAVVDESLNGQASRRNLISRFLQEYESALKEAVEKPLISTTMQDPLEQRRIALAKAPLFFIALEDAYGEDPVRRGLAEVLALLRGQSVRYPDIRAALENVTNKDLTPMFRLWIYKTGIPDEFREKYEGAKAGND